MPGMKHLACPHSGCSKAYNRPALLEQHLRSHTNTRPFACPHDPCPKTFIRQGHLTQHVQDTHQNTRDHACDVEGCGKAFPTSSKLKRHKVAHENQGRHRCAEDGCGQSFRKAATLAKHRVTVHEGKAAFTCDEIVGEGVPCGKGFHTAFKLKVHRERNHTEERFCCTMCKVPQDHGKLRDMPFSTHADFLAHKKAVHPPACSECGHISRCPADLAQHFDEKHNPNPPPKKVESYNCEEDGCGAAFDRKSSWRNHVKYVHTTARPFACKGVDTATLHRVGAWDGANACDQAFKTKARLERHVRSVHLGHRDAKRKTSEEPAGAGLGPTKKKGRHTGPSRVDLLTGAAVVLCPRSGCPFRCTSDPDLLVHLQKWHGLAVAEIQNSPRKPVDEGGEKDELDVEAQEALDAMGWEQRQEQKIARGGNFWLGGGDDEESDGWEADEMEMRRLVGTRESREDEMPVDPTLR